MDRNYLKVFDHAHKAELTLVGYVTTSYGKRKLEEVKADPDHPMRAEFDRFVVGFVDRLRTSKQYARRAEQLKRDLLTRPELRDLAGDMWTSLKSFIEQDAQAPDSMIRRHLAELFVDVGRQLAADPKIRADMNEGCVVALSSFVESQKSGVSAFIAEQVKGRLAA